MVGREDYFLAYGNRVQAIPTKPKKSLTERSLRILKILLVLGIVLLIVLGFLFDFINFGITFERSSDVHTLFSILNAIVVGVMINVLGFSSGKMKLQYKLIMLIVLVTFVVLEFGQIGFWFEIKWDLLVQQYYQSNSVYAIQFIYKNWYFWVLVVGASYLTESEIKL